MVERDAKTRIYEAALAHGPQRHRGHLDPGDPRRHRDQEPVGDLVPLRLEGRARRASSPRRSPGGQYPILEQQTELASGATMPTAAEWVAPVIDTSIELVSTERGCLLARLWWEFDGYLRRSRSRHFLSGDSEIATEWRARDRQGLPAVPTHDRRRPQRHRAAHRRLDARAHGGDQPLVGPVHRPDAPAVPALAGGDRRHAAQHADAPHRRRRARPRCGVRRT